jgi:hypothetical protein
MNERYVLSLNKCNKKTKLAILANDSAHAQAQALDIIRAFNADGYSLTYGTYKDTDLSRLFCGLAFNTFTHKFCYTWTATECNKVPCCYVFGERFYLRNVILRYLDIPKDDLITKNSCKCGGCVNPYHFAYVTEKNEKLSSGDLKLLVAYRSQGAGVAQIATALKVHRSTIYRRLKDEPLPSRT